MLHLRFNSPFQKDQFYPDAEVAMNTNRFWRLFLTLDFIKTCKINMVMAYMNMLDFPDKTRKKADRI